MKRFSSVYRRNDLTRLPFATKRYGYPLITTEIDHAQAFPFVTAPIGFASTPYASSRVPFSLR